MLLPYVWAYAETGRGWTLSPLFQSSDSSLCGHFSAGTGFVRS